VCGPLELGALRPVPGDDEREAGARACGDRGVDALLRREPGRDERVRPGARGGPLGGGRDGMTHDVHGRVAERRAELAKAGQGECARHHDGVGVLDGPLLPQRQPRPVRERLRPRAAAGAAHARRGVAPVAAGALLALGEADPDRADEAVVVQLQHGARPRAASCGERAPAVCRQQVVGVHDPRAGSRHRVADLRGVRAAPQQAGRRRRA
jgi:hypothetical protein